MVWRVFGGPGSPEPEWQHTLLWVHILTSGEPHPLPAEHWPTDGAVGGNRQRKQKHVEIRRWQRWIFSQTTFKRILVKWYAFIASLCYHIYLTALFMEHALMLS